MNEHAALIATLRGFPEALEAVVGGLTAEQLTTPFVDGEWTVAQNVHHLADAHTISFIRTKLILNEDIPLLPVFHQDDWARSPEAMSADLGPSLATLRIIHARWADLFAQLDEQQLARIGMHPKRGPLSLLKILNLYVAHGAGHLDQIQRTLAAEKR